MSSRRRVFYAERDKRSRQYGAEDSALERPVHIVIGADVAATRAGQIAALALVNMVARVHRRIRLDVPAAGLIARSMVPGDELSAVSRATALAINPVLDLVASVDSAQFAPAVSIGLGELVPDDLDMYLGWTGGQGILFSRPSAGDAFDPSSVFGAAAAAVLGAAGLFRSVHGQSVRGVRFNPIELTSDCAAGTRDQTQPIDAGTVLVVGAGAVASALAYWVREIGTSGALWDFVDGDTVELHNTNRCLTMTAAHAGWAEGAPTGIPARKAHATAWAVDGNAHPQWYEQWLPQHQTRHDLVLCLANERGARPFVAERGEPLLVHATTSANWTAELHRHVPDRDDCPACRLPDTRVARPMCATGPVDPTQPDSPDAALPFLSAASGLLLTAALAELPEGIMYTDARNHWQLDLTFPERLLRSHRWPSSAQCPHQPAQSIRRTVQRDAPRRWDRLDTNATAG